jgi:hypothetical protein
MPELKHYGILRRSGRYKYGSGKKPYQSSIDFLGRVKELMKGKDGEKLTYTEIGKTMGMKSGELRAKITNAKNETYKYELALALRLKDKGLKDRPISERMGKPIGTIRSMLDPIRQERALMKNKAIERLKASVEKDKYIDIGPGTDRRLGITKTELNSHIYLLEQQGYKRQYIKQLQAGTGKYTTITALTKADVSYNELKENKHKIALVGVGSQDSGKPYIPQEPPKNISSARVAIRYSDDSPSGGDKDGVIELRRGVDDISLNKAHYAQVRIAVDGTHYIKGMAMYSDSLPEGVDILFNTSKTSDVSKMDVLKKQKTDNPESPFGATIRGEGELILAQRYYTGKDGKKELSALNIVNEEGNWGTWSKTLSSQMLSKQAPSLIKKQLNEGLTMKREEFEEIMMLTEPAIKQKLLLAFADDCDASAVHLEAASLPRQKSQVLLPIASMPEDQIFAPNFRNGERVVVIRYPHGGVFEIPNLVVNNKQPEAVSLLSGALDAVGIKPIVSEQLSGADFDGDTGLVIPNNEGAIKTRRMLEGLRNFKPRELYKLPGDSTMSDKTKGLEMGKISNLITDMQIKGATFDDEICFAIKHSMVVIDAQNHNLDYKQSYLDNHIAALKEKYQGSAKAGASTIISRAGAEERVDFREEGKYIYDPALGRKKRVFVDPETGKKLYEVKKEKYPIYKDLTGKRVSLKGIPYAERLDLVDAGVVKETMVRRTTKTTKMAEEENAYKLTSDGLGGTDKELPYANYANQVKAMALEARKASLTIEYTPMSVSGKRAYAKERESLIVKLGIAQDNAPLERQAQLMTDSIVTAQQKDNPGMNDDTLRKIRGRALVTARRITGAGKHRIEINDSEWNAIQAGALGKDLLKKILNNTDLDVVKQRAMPRTTKGMSASKVARAKNMLQKGETQSDVADILGVSVSTLMINMR